VGVQLLVLLREIETCRQEMICLASETSYANSQVIEISVKLDSLLNKYHLLRKTQAL
jgi:hypothetical protein